MTNDERRKLHRLFTAMLRASRLGVGGWPARNEAITLLDEWTTLWPAEVEDAAEEPPRLEVVGLGWEVGPPEWSVGVVSVVARRDGTVGVQVRDQHGQRNTIRLTVESAQTLGVNVIGAFRGTPVSCSFPSLDDDDLIFRATVPGEEGVLGVWPGAPEDAAYIDVRVPRPSFPALSAALHEAAQWTVKLAKSKETEAPEEEPAPAPTPEDGPVSTRDHGEYIEVYTRSGGEVWVQKEAAAGYVNLYVGEKRGVDDNAAAESLWFDEALAIADALVKKARVAELAWREREKAREAAEGLEARGWWRWIVKAPQPRQPIELLNHYGETFKTNKQRNGYFDERGTERLAKSTVWRPLPDPEGWVYFSDAAPEEGQRIEVEGFGPRVAAEGGWTCPTQGTLMDGVDGLGTSHRWRPVPAEEPTPGDDGWHTLSEKAPPKDKQVEVRGLHYRQTVRRAYEVEAVAPTVWVHRPGDLFPWMPLRDDAQWRLANLEEDA